MQWCSTNLHPLNPKLPRSTCVSLPFAHVGCPLSELSAPEQTRQNKRQHHRRMPTVNLLARTAAHHPRRTPLLDCCSPLRQVRVHKIKSRDFGVVRCPVGLDSIPHPVFQCNHPQEKSVVGAGLEPLCVLCPDLSSQVRALRANLPVASPVYVFEYSE